MTLEATPNTIIPTVYWKCVQDYGFSALGYGFSRGELPNRAQKSGCEMRPEISNLREKCPEIAAFSVRIYNRGAVLQVLVNMLPGKIALMLVYEPESISSRPVPLARICDDMLAKQAAIIALTQAESRAREMSTFDETLADIERDEADRLWKLLSAMMPGSCTDKVRSSPVM